MKTENEDLGFCPCCDTPTAGTHCSVCNYDWSAGF